MLGNTCSHTVKNILCTPDPYLRPRSLLLRALPALPSTSPHNHVVILCSVFLNEPTEPPSELCLKPLLLSSILLHTFPSMVLSVDVLGLDSRPDHNFSDLLLYHGNPLLAIGLLY